MQRNENGTSPNPLYCMCTEYTATTFLLFTFKKESNIFFCINTKKTLRWRLKKSQTGTNVRRRTFTIETAYTFCGWTTRNQLIWIVVTSRLKIERKCRRPNCLCWMNRARLQTTSMTKTATTTTRIEASIHSGCDEYAHPMRIICRHYWDARWIFGERIYLFEYITMLSLIEIQCSRSLLLYRNDRRVQDSSMNDYLLNLRSRCAINLAMQIIYL